MDSLENNEVNLATATKIEKGSNVFRKCAGIEDENPLENLYLKLFPDGGIRGTHQIIEISGASGSAKTLVLLEIMANVILPIEYGGKNLKVIYLETDYHFLFQNFGGVLRKLVQNYTDDSDCATAVIIDSLSRFSYYQFITGDELWVTLETIKLILIDDPSVALLALDSINCCTRTGHLENMARLLSFRSVMRTFKKILQPRVAFIYTKTHCPSTGYPDISISYYIRLSTERVLKSQEQNEESTSSEPQSIRIFTAKIINTDETNYVQTFKVDRCGVRWL